MNIDFLVINLSFKPIISLFWTSLMAIPTKNYIHIIKEVPVLSLIGLSLVDF